MKAFCTNALKVTFFNVLLLSTAISFYHCIHHSMVQLFWVWILCIHFILAPKNIRRAAKCAVNHVLQYYTLKHTMHVEMFDNCWYLYRLCCYSQGLWVTYLSTLIFKMDTHLQLSIMSADSKSVQMGIYLKQVSGRGVSLCLLASNSMILSYELPKWKNHLWCGQVTAIYKCTTSW